MLFRESAAAKLWGRVSVPVGDVTGAGEGVCGGFDASSEVCRPAAANGFPDENGFPLAPCPVENGLPDAKGFVDAELVDGCVPNNESPIYAGFEG